MNIEEAFNILTGDREKCFNEPRGTTKKEVKELCGSEWDERDWRRMVNKVYRSKLGSSLPFFNKKERKWYWF